MPVKVCAIQLSAEENVGRNRIRALERVKIAAGKGAQLIALPALFAQRWPFVQPDLDREELARLAEPADGETLTRFARAAEETGAALVVPFLERDGDALYHSTGVIDGDGELRGVYRKAHLPDYEFWNERQLFAPGNELPVFETCAGRVAVQIGYDNLFSDATRILADKGAEILVAPCAHAHATHEKWRNVLCAHAFLYGLHVLRVNRVGEEDQLHFYGASFCASPEGELEGEPADMKEAVLLWEIEPGLGREIREQWNLAPARREDLYRRK